MPGQAVRGETPLVFMAPFARYIRAEAARLGRFLGLGEGEAMGLICRCGLIVNVCDTAGVREGLMTDDLLGAFREVFGDVLAVASAETDNNTKAFHTENHIERMLAAREAARWDREEGGGQKAKLLNRLLKLRSARQRRGEPPQSVADVLDGLESGVLDVLCGWFSHCQFWYAEAATAALNPEAQLKVLALGMRAAKYTAQIDQTKPYNVSLMPLVRRLNPEADRAAAYRVRLMEVLLAGVSLGEIALAKPGALGFEGVQSGQGGQAESGLSALGTFRVEIGGAAALTVLFDESAEAKALLTLLPIYEAKSSAAFHATLKALCDLYGLRKDAFDRMSNEAVYLVHMNSARSDKSRMLDFVKQGRVVEVGPGGGVILNLLEERYADSEIIGVDVSQMVVEALLAIKAREHRRWTVIEADAFDMPARFGAESVDTIIFCSLLHEIYSYVEYPADDDLNKTQRRRFRLESVRDLLRAAYKTLKPGGRIIIRDGVKPPPGERILRFCNDAARGFFKLFVEQFEGRAVQGRWLDEWRVLLSSEDAMEFLYTYTWGPESFPYEVREQYGIMTYADYQQNLLLWLADSTHPPALVPLPDDLQSYLQPGYQKGLADQALLYDAHDQPVSLPDSNCLLVIENTAPKHCRPLPPQAPPEGRAGCALSVSSCCIASGSWRRPLSPVLEGPADTGKERVTRLPSPSAPLVLKQKCLRPPQKLTAVIGATGGVQCGGR